PLIASVRRQLGLAPVLAAEEALSARPNDPQLRLRLANACAATGDPVGAALALEPLLDRIGGIDRMGNGQLVARFVRDSARVGWREEAATALRRAPDVPPRTWLELADTFAT